ncbi:hypothetical protein OsJ_07705 [Oryza sativa Japonica Group]|uniref:Vacuolar iron transporter n=1 Tax=Oryza sativa subsp. japonica TaxID=39947 RepID=B9F1C3_ORYSJ|nr:hypothetical protein OsJ_07705 [Oryza sativa Japonica Group]
MAIDLGCHVGCASPETKQEETADPTAAPVVVDDVEAAAGGRRPGDGGGVNYVARAQWLRAAVLGANDGLVSVASLMVGVGAANGTRRAMLVSGLAGLVAGACSMAIGGVRVRVRAVRHPGGPDRARARRQGRQRAARRRRSCEPTMAAVASALSFAAGAALPLLAGGFVRPWAARVAAVCAASSPRPRRLRRGERVPRRRGRRALRRPDARGRVARHGGHVRGA